jgi:hypothetical protein
MKRLIFDEDHELFRDSVRRFMQSEVTPSAAIRLVEICLQPMAAICL